MAFTVVMLAGTFQILFGIFKLGPYVALVPFLVGVPPDVAKTLRQRVVVKLLPETHYHVSRPDALKQAAVTISVGQTDP